MLLESYLIEPFLTAVTTMIYYAFTVLYLMLPKSRSRILDRTRSSVISRIATGYFLFQAWNLEAHAQEASRLERLGPFDLVHESLLLIDELWFSPQHCVHCGPTPAVGCGLPQEPAAGDPGRAPRGPPEAISSGGDGG